MSHNQEALQKIAENSLYAQGVSRAMVEYSFDVFARHLHKGRVLELGPAEGVMTGSIREIGERFNSCGRGKKVL